MAIRTCGTCCATKFYAPVHAVTVTASVTNVTSRSGYVEAVVHYNGRNVGTVPERGTWIWTIRDGKGKMWLSGRARSRRSIRDRAIGHAIKVRIGLA